MSRCTCNNPCTCYFEYDGDRPNTPYTLPFQQGRYSTRKSGAGTPANPYVIEFLDSEEFQVEAGQIARSADLTGVPSGTNFNSVPGFDTIVYETPTEIFMAHLIHIGDGEMYPSAHKFWFVSAEATFVNNGSGSGTRTLLVFWHPPMELWLLPTLSSMVIAGNVSSSLPGGTEDMTINCNGLIPMMNTTEEINFFGPGGSLGVYLQQNSGATGTVRNIKLSLVAV